MINKILERPTKLSEVLQFVADNDLEMHLRAIKKAFPQVKILRVEKGDGKPRKLRSKREPVQTALF